VAYKGVNIPEELMQEIEKVLKKKKHGFTSKAEFVKQAIREKLKQFP